MCIPLLVAYTSYSQCLKGRVIDLHTGEGIPYARIEVQNINIGANSNENGEFILTHENLPERIILTVSATLYETQEIAAVCCDSLIVRMDQDHHEMVEIVIKVDPGILNKNTTVHSDRLNMRELKLSSPTGLVEALTSINGVQQISAGMSAGKPVIRGMQGMRVVTFLEGMRIENQQWGNDHGLGISQLGIQSAEIIKGPAGLLYAGDALGGVIYLNEDRSAAYNKVTIDVSSAFESVSLGTTNSVMAKLHQRNSFISVGALSSSFADFQLTNGSYLNDSRFQDHGAKLGYVYFKDKLNIEFDYLFSKSIIGIPGHTHDSLATADSYITDEQNRSISLPLQDVMNHFFNGKLIYNLNEKHSLKLQASHTFNDFAEFEEKVFTPEMRMRLNNSTVRFDHIWRPKYTIRVNSGFQSSLQSNVNFGNPDDELLPNSNQLDYAAFSSFFSRLGPFELSAVARLDARNLSSDLVNRSFVVGNGSVGVLYKWWALSNNIIRLNVSSGSRAPHIAELTANGQHHGASRYEIGDANLNPERATQIDLDYEFKTNHFSFSVNPYFSYLQNYIQLSPLDSTVENFPVYAYQAIQKARMYGVDAGVHYHPKFANWLHLESGYSITYGESFEPSPLTFMPQPLWRSKARVALRPKKKLGFTGFMVQHQFYFEQNRVTSLETPTDAYHLIQIAASVKLDTKTPFELTFGVRNLLNETYVNHLSRLKNIGLTEPGRSFYIKLSTTINCSLRGTKESESKLENNILSH